MRGGVEGGERHDTKGLRGGLLEYPEMKTTLPLTSIDDDEKFLFYPL